MRKDVKAGMVFSLVIVVLAGWYYSRDDETGGAIPLDNRVSSVGDSEENGLDGETGFTEVELTKTPAPISSPKKPDEATGRLNEENAFLASGTESEKAPGILNEAGGQEKEVSEAGGEIRVGLTDKEREFLLADREDDTDLPGELESEESSLDSQLEPQAADTEKNAGIEEQEPTASEVTLPVPTDTVAKPESRKEDKVKKKPEPALVKNTGRNADSVERYTVQTGDSLAILAEVYYGSQRFTDFLLRANPQISNENQLRVGMVISIPGLPDKTRREILNSKAEKQTSPEEKGAGKSTYTVKAGDSFYRIAEQQLGSANRWKEILELNKSLVGGDPQRLRPGQVLVLPKK